MEENVIFETRGDVGFIQMNRPKKLNALTTEMIGALRKSVFEAEIDSKIRVIIISGSERSFCAGADIEEEKEMTTSDVLRFCRKGQELCAALYFSTKPVIAAISGYALGGGLELALACDFRISSEKASFGFPEVTLAVTTGWGGASALTRLIGPSKAKELLMFGKKVDAHEAHKIGLVNEVVDPENLLKRAGELASGLSALSAQAVASIKALVNSYSKLWQPEDLFLEAVTDAFCYSQEEKAKAYQAFLNRNPSS